MVHNIDVSNKIQRRYEDEDGRKKERYKWEWRELYPSGYLRRYEKETSDQSFRVTRREHNLAESK